MTWQWSSVFLADTCLELDLCLQQQKQHACCIINAKKHHMRTTQVTQTLSFLKSDGNCSSHATAKFGMWCSHLRCTHLFWCWHCCDSVTSTNCVTEHCSGVDLAGNRCSWKRVVSQCEMVNGSQSPRVLALAMAAWSSSCLWNWTQPQIFVFVWWTKESFVRKLAPLSNPGRNFGILLTRKHQLCDLSRWIPSCQTMNRIDFNWMMTNVGFVLRFLLWQECEMILLLFWTSDRQWLGGNEGAKLAFLQSVTDLFVLWKWHCITGFQVCFVVSDMLSLCCCT